MNSVILIVSFTMIVASLVMCSFTIREEVMLVQLMAAFLWGIIFSQALLIDIGHRRLDVANANIKLLEKSGYSATRPADIKFTSQR